MTENLASHFPGKVKETKGLHHGEADLSSHLWLPLLCQLPGSGRVCDVHPEFAFAFSTNIPEDLITESTARRRSASRLQAVLCWLTAQCVWPIDVLVESNATFCTRDGQKHIQLVCLTTSSTLPYSILLQQSRNADVAAYASAILTMCQLTCVGSGPSSAIYPLLPPLPHHQSQHHGSLSNTT